MDEPINPLQAMVNGMSEGWRKERSKTQMTLGALIKALEGVDPNREIVGFGDAISYRGYYSDLAFEPAEEAIRVSAALKEAQGCMGRTFEGYKGGDYMMGDETPVWSAEYGDSSCPRIMGLNLESNPITLELKLEED